MVYPCAMQRTLALRLALSLPLIAACKSDPAPQPEAPANTTKTAVTAAPQPKATASATVTAMATASVAPPPSASASASAATLPPRSARPTAKEWCEADLAVLGFEGHEGGEELAACKLLAVREWAMIWCPRNGRRSGTNLGNYDHGVPGGGSMATSEELAAGPNGDAEDAVVVSFKPGTKAKPSFFYRPASHPEWIKDESFVLELPADATSLSQRRLNDAAWPPMRSRAGDARCADIDAAAKAAAQKAADDKARQSVEEDAKGKPDVAGIEALPADDVWAAEREVNVSGSDALGCKTKVKDSWFWMRCEGKAAITAIEVEKGKRATQTTATVEGGVVKLTTPYVEETDLRAKLVTAGGDRFLKLKWLKGKRPAAAGSIGDSR